MYKLIAFTSKASKQDIKRAEQWMQMTESTAPIYNIPHHRVEDHVKANTIVVAFGKLARIAVEQHIEDKHLQNTKVFAMPHLNALTRKVENRTSRAHGIMTMKNVRLLVEASLFQPTGLVIKEQDLPDLDARHLLLLQKITEEAEQNSCFQVTKGGKLIEISNEKMDDSRADIHLTFHELYTIKLAMDVLKTTEVTIVGNSKESTT